jgi:biotin carboxyl carrier protein
VASPGELEKLMKLKIKIHSGAKTSEHECELSTRAGGMQGRTGAASSGAKIHHPAPRPRPELDDGHGAMEKPQPLLQDDAKLGDPHKAPLEGKAGTPHQPEKLFRFFSDGEPLMADGEEISPGVYSILIDGRSYEAQVSKRAGDAEGYLSPYVVTVGLRHYLVEIRDPRRWRRDGAGVQERGPQEIVAPMPGKIVKVLVSENQEVVLNQGLLVIEAMKMQNEIRAPRAGRVQRIYAQEQTGVEAGVRLLRLV